MDEILKIIVLTGSAGAVIWKTYKATRLIEDMHKDTKQRKKENAVIIRGVQASLDGLTQMGCNGDVTKAKQELDDFLIMNRE